MFNSLKSWCKQTLTVCRPGTFTPSGEMSDERTFELKCLLVNDSKLFTDRNGELAVCRCYAYVIPTEPIFDTDKIQLPGTSIKYDIRKLGGYTDGNTGELSIQVVYL